jgi:DNA-binding NtrC family response regulator
MTMVYGLMKQHGGFVNVRSELGAGTTIRLYLPVARSAAMTPIEPETVAFALGNETILLVEDDESLRRAGRRVLELHGYIVMTARNGVEGLETILAHAGKIDLVIADLVMPLMGGAELHGAVSQSGTPPKFIFASGYGGGDQAARSQLDHNISLIEKPWTFAKLLGAVRDTLDHGRSPDAKR